MPTNVSNRGKRERGQTLALVAISVIALLGMAALAIDVVSLYVARGQAERAADAAALAAAKVLADAGVTTDPANSSNIWTSACAAAVIEAQNVASQNEVAGMLPTTSQVTVTFPGDPACGNSTVFGINPQVQVAVQVTGVPTFFAKIWNAAASTVTGTALAEAYNPSNSSSLPMAQTVPVAPRCVKPMLLPNCDPAHGGGGNCGGYSTFIDPGTGAITNPGLHTGGGVIGEQFPLIANCFGGTGATNCNQWLTSSPTAGYYYPLSISSASSSSANYFCPASSASCSSSSSGPAFQQDLECCNGVVLQCGTPLSGQSPTVDTTDSPNNNEAVNGTQCLINGNSPNSPTCNPPTEQDCLFGFSNPPMQILAGSNNPLLGAAPANVQAGDQITTSLSVVTLPLYDGLAAPTPGSGVYIIGYLQAFINSVDMSGPGGIPAIHVTVMNVSGCGGSFANPVTGVPVYGAGPPVPVRLISSGSTIGP